MQTTITVTVLGAQHVSFTNDKGQEQSIAKIFICNPALPAEADKFKGMAVQTMDTTPEVYKSLTLPAAPVLCELTVTIKTAAKGKAGFLVDALRIVEPMKKAS